MAPRCGPGTTRAPTALHEVFVHFVKQPVYEFVRIVVLVVVEKGVRGFDGRDEPLVVVGTALFLLGHQLLEEQVELQEHVLFPACAALGLL